MGLCAVATGGAGTAYLLVYDGEDEHYDIEFSFCPYCGQEIEMATTHGGEGSVTQQNRGGFCRYGNFIWIDGCGQERMINPALVDVVTLYHQSDIWYVTVCMTAYEGSLTFSYESEAEARKLAQLIVGDSGA